MKSFKYISLSHWIDENTPTYNNSGSFNRYSITSIINGNSSNSEDWKFNNHIGTHIDFPFHFYENGRKSSDFKTPFFINKKIGFIELETICEPGEVISVNHIKKQSGLLENDIEVLLLKTGFQKYRNDIAYWSKNPGYDKSLFVFFRMKFPNLKFFGFDTISLTSVLNRNVGKEAHLSFLNILDPILVIEDMDLSILNSNLILDELIIAPILIANSDGAPVNCILKFNDEKNELKITDFPYTI